MERSVIFSRLRWGVVAVLATAGPSLATKPCIPGPCEAPGGGTDLKRCQSVADWVAVGTITKVVRHEQGPPLNKDFAEFTFTVNTWEKGAGKPLQEIRFQVGWCENTRPLPRDTSGLFRFFGPALPADPSLPNHYLHFEPVPLAKP
jgi:hypothetical protein